MTTTTIGPCLSTGERICAGGHLRPERALGRLVGAGGQADGRPRGVGAEAAEVQGAVQESTRTNQSAAQVSFWGRFGRKIEGDSWFAWWFNQLPGPFVFVFFFKKDT